MIKQAKDVLKTCIYLTSVAVILLVLLLYHNAWLSVNQSLSDTRWYRHIVHSNITNNVRSISNNVTNMTQWKWNQKSRIPNYIHQICISCPHGMVPMQYKRFVTGCKRVNSDSKYVLWTDKDIDKLIADHYPRQVGLMKYFTGLKKSDAARYFILHHYGGYYLDMDMECRRPLSQFLEGGDCFVDREREEQSWILYGFGPIAMNSLLGCARNHSFYTMLLKELPSRKTRPDILESTGPFFLKDVFRKYSDSIGQNRPVIMAKSHSLSPLIDTGRRSHLRNLCATIVKSAVSNKCHHDTSGYVTLTYRTKAGRPTSIQSNKHVLRPNRNQLKKGTSKHSTILHLLCSLCNSTTLDIYTNTWYSDCARVNKDMTVILWTADDIRKFAVEVNASTDSISRLAIIYHFGGAYVDRQTRCLKPLSSIRKSDHTCYFGQLDSSHPSKGVHFSAAVCVKNHTFVTYLINQLRQKGALQTAATEASIFNNALKSYNKLSPQRNPVPTVKTTGLLGTQSPLQTCADSTLHAKLKSCLALYTTYFDIDEDALTYNSFTIHKFLHIGWTNFGAIRDRFNVGKEFPRVYRYSADANVL